MSTISQNRRYIPHSMATKVHSVETYRNGNTVEFVCRKYHISKASLMRWNRVYDGTKESLAEKSHRPHSSHPNAHTEAELKMIRDLHRRNPQIGVTEMYGKLKRKGYQRHPGSLYRVLVRLGYRKEAPESTKKKHNKPYDTPTELGKKWQMDVKYVPRSCYVGEDGQRFYQYTVIDEASRQRFIYPYMEQNSYSTIDFFKRAILYFGYVPEILQTDNGFEFSNWTDRGLPHLLDMACEKMAVIHKLIKPRTPEHNGKVERSHRNDQERFYNYLSFYSYEDLVTQMEAYLRRSNNIPSKTLDWLSPIEKRKQLMPVSKVRPVKKKPKKT